MAGKLISIFSKFDILIFIVSAQSLFGQQEDGLVKNALASPENIQNPNFISGLRPDTVVRHHRQFPLNHFILPTAMVAYGFISLNNDILRDIDIGTQEEVF